MCLLTVTDVPREETKPAVMLIVSGTDDCDTVVARGTECHGNAESDAALAATAKCKMDGWCETLS